MKSYMFAQKYDTSVFWTEKDKEVLNIRTGVFYGITHSEFCDNQPVKWNASKSYNLKRIFWAQTQKTRCMRQQRRTFNVAMHMKIDPVQNNPLPKRFLRGTMQLDHKVRDLSETAHLALRASPSLWKEEGRERDRSPQNVVQQWVVDAGGGPPEAWAFDPKNQKQFLAHQGHWRGWRRKSCS